MKEYREESRREEQQQSLVMLDFYDRRRTRKIQTDISGIYDREEDLMMNSFVAPEFVEDDRDYYQGAAMMIGGEEKMAIEDIANLLNIFHQGSARPVEMSREAYERYQESLKKRVHMRRDDGQFLIAETKKKAHQCKTQVVEFKTTEEVLVSGPETDVEIPIIAPYEFERRASLKVAAKLGVRHLTIQVRADSKEHAYEYTRQCGEERVGISIQREIVLDDSSTVLRGQDTIMNDRGGDRKAYHMCRVGVQVACGCRLYCTQITNGLLRGTSISKGFYPQYGEKSMEELSTTGGVYSWVEKALMLGMTYYRMKGDVAIVVNSMSGRPRTGDSVNLMGIPRGHFKQFKHPTHVQLTNRYLRSVRSMDELGAPWLIAMEMWGSFNDSILMNLINLYYCWGSRNHPLQGLRQFRRGMLEQLTWSPRRDFLMRRPGELEEADEKRSRIEDGVVFEPGGEGGEKKDLS